MKTAKQLWNEYFKKEKEYEKKRNEIKKTMEENRMLGGYDPEKILAAEIAIGKWEDEKKRNEIESKNKSSLYIKKYCQKLRNLEVNMYNLTDENIIEKVLIERLIDTQQRIMEGYLEQNKRESK